MGVVMCDKTVIAAMAIMHDCPAVVAPPLRRRGQCRQGERHKSSEGRKRKDAMEA